MAIEAGDELNKDGVQDDTRSYSDKVEQETQGREGETVSLGEVINSVDTYRNVKKSCEYFPNIKVDSILMSKLKSVFASRGLGEPRKDMMIMTKDIEAIVEIVRSFTDDLIQDISDDFNGLVLSKDGRINEIETRKQTADFNMQHPGETINIDVIPETYFSNKAEAKYNKQKEDYEISARNGNKFSMKDIDFEKIIAESFYRKDDYKEYEFQNYDDWYPVIDRVEAEKKLDEAYKEVVVSKKEKNEIKDFMEDPRNAGLLEELEYAFEANIYGITLTDQGRVGMVEIVNYYREQFARDPSVMALPESQRQAKIDELINAQREKIIEDVFTRQEYLNAEMANKAGVATADEALLLEAISLSRNKERSEYDSIKFNNFVVSHPDFFAEREFNEETQGFFTQEELDYFEEKQRYSHAYKIQKARNDALEPDILTDEDKNKTIKRLLFGLRKATDPEHFDSIARADYLSAIESISGREDIIDWEKGRINEDVFYEFYKTIDDTPVTISELADQGLVEIDSEFERFLDRSLTEINMGTWVDADIEGIEDELEKRKRFKAAADKNVKNKRGHIITLSHPNSYREAMELSFISNVIVRDKKQNEKLLKKDPSLRELLDAEGNLTPEAWGLYKGVFNHMVYKDIDKYTNPDYQITSPLEKKEAFELVACVANRDASSVYSYSVDLAKRICPESVKKDEKGHEYVDEDVLLGAYNKFVTENQLGDSMESLKEMRKYARDKLGFKYDKALGVIYDFYRDRVEIYGAEPEDKDLDVIDLAFKERERAKTRKAEQEERRSKVTRGHYKQAKAPKAKLVNAEAKEKAKTAPAGTIKGKVQDGTIVIHINKELIKNLADVSLKRLKHDEQARERAKRKLSGKAKYISGEYSVSFSGTAPKKNGDKTETRTDDTLETVVIKKPEIMAESPETQASIKDDLSGIESYTMINDLFDDSGEISISLDTAASEKEFEKAFARSHQLVDEMRRAKKENPELFKRTLDQVVSQLKEIVQNGDKNAADLIKALRLLAEEKAESETLVSDSEFDFYKESKGMQQITVILGSTKTVSSEELMKADKTLEPDVTGAGESEASSNSGGTEKISASELTEVVGESEIRVGEPAKENEAPKPKSEGEDKKAAEEKVTEENEQEMEY